MVVAVAVVAVVATIEGLEVTIEELEAMAIAMEPIMESILEATTEGLEVTIEDLEASMD